MAKEKLNELKEKVQELQEELRELTDEELEQIFGGYDRTSFQTHSITNYTIIAE